MSDAEKTVEITLDVPITNIVNGGKKTYQGKVRVPKGIADDLKRREHEYLMYERSLIRNNGSTVAAGSLIGGQAE
jgi:hypothetical protein